MAPVHAPVRCSRDPVHFPFVTCRTVLAIPARLRRAAEQPAARADAGPANDESAPPSEARIRLLTANCELPTGRYLIARYLRLRSLKYLSAFSSELSMASISRLRKPATGPRSDS